MKTIFFLLLLCMVPTLLMAQSKPGQYLQKLVLKDSTYVPARLYEHLENNAIPTVDENEIKSIADNAIPPLLQASRDPYQAIAGFQFAEWRIGSKGLGNAFNKVLVNGQSMTDLASGTGLWSSWNGLSPIFRISENSSVFQQADAGISVMGSVSNIDIRPYKQKAGVDLGYGFGSRGATQKTFLGLHTGLSAKGWSIGLALAARTSLAPLIPGVRSQGRSGYLAIDKKMGSADILSLAVFGSLVASDRQSSVLMESVRMLEDPSYNPVWGYQNGQQRNANHAVQSQPMGMLSEEHRFSNQSYLQTTLSYSSGYRNATGLDWYHAPDPRPDYYRYLPSYQTDLAIQQAETAALQNNVDLRQINWNRFYQINRNSYELIENANGILGNTVGGNRARYIVENRHQDIQRVQWSATYHGLLTEEQFFSAGLHFQWQESTFYKTVDDLLGADFYVNWNQFAESEIPNDPLAIQFDIHQPNRILRLGNQFGYDYRMTHYTVGSWFQTSAQKGKWGYALSLELAQSAYWRNGLVANGLFPNQSLGLSKKNVYLTKGIKWALNHVINGRSRFYLSLAVQSSPPFADNVFLSPKTRNDQAEDMVPQHLTSLELGYLLQSPNLKSRFSLYWTQLKNGMDVLSFYHDGYNSFVNYAISGIGERHLGIEWGVDAKLLGQWHFQGALHLGDFIYNTRQTANITVDNTAAQLNQVTIYAKQHPIGGAPQQAISLGFNHRNNQNWFWVINANFFDRQWITWNPIRRTSEALYPLDPASEKGQKLLLQERLPAQCQVNGFISKRFMLSTNGNSHLDLSLSVNNLLNKRDLILSAAEQLRFDFDNRDSEKFPPKYFFGQGLNMSLSINYHF